MKRKSNQIKYKNKENNKLNLKRNNHQRLSSVAHEKCKCANGLIDNHGSEAKNDNSELIKVNFLSIIWRFNTFASHLANIKTKK